MSIGYQNSTKYIYFQTGESFEKLMSQVKLKEFTMILLYCLGEVADILFHTIMTIKTNKVNFLSFIDHDSNKIRLKIGNSKKIFKKKPLDMLKIMAFCFKRNTKKIIKCL